MNDNIRIIIQAILNQNTTKNIDEQLKQVSNKLQKININVNTDQLKKATLDYEQWWAKAIDKEAKLREKALQEEQKTRRAIDQQNLKEREQALQQEQKIRRQIEENTRKELETTAKKQREMDLIHQRALQENAKFDQQARNNNSLSDLNNQEAKTMSIASKIKEMAVSVPLWFAGMTVFMTAVHAFTEGFRGMIEIESKMAGYIQTNEKYFVTFAEGSHEMILNTQKANEESEKFIQTTHALGAEIDNVLESARLWGRMYKDVAVVQELVRQSTQLSTVDLVGLNEATKMMEATIAQYGVQIHNVNDAQREGTRILDSWSSVAHDTMAPAKDLGDAFERTGKIASETGVSFDFMNGLISAGVRNTALGGANLGNMWKTVLGTIRTDKAVDELERLGVATKELVDGTETWRKAEDILLDLSIAVTDKNYDLTKSYQDISRGVYQFAKLAASLNAGDILLGVSASINSTGATMEYLMVQMDTIERKTKQVKTSLLEVFNNAGDDGLRSSIKSILDVIDQLLIGLTKIPKGTFEITTAIIGMVAAYNLLIKPIIAWRTAQVALNASIGVHAAVNVAATESMVVFNAAAMATARTVALATGGISLLVAGIAMYITSLGKQEQAERKATEVAERALAVKEQQISQYQRQSEFLDKLSAAHDKLTESLKNQSLTEEQKANISGQLVKVEQALSETVGQAGLERIKAAGFTKEAIQIEMNAISDKRQVAITETLKVINIDRQETTSRITEAKKRIAVLQEEMKVQKAKADQESQNLGYKISSGEDSIPIIGGIKNFLKDNLPMIDPFGVNPEKENDKYKKMQAESISLQKTLEDGQKKLDELSEKTTTLTTDSVNDALAGISGKNTNSGQSYEDRKASFQEKMSNFQHLVNMEVDGYKDASGQLEKLQAIRRDFSDLNSDDLYGIDENIHRAQEGIANKAKGISTGSAPPSPYDESDKYEIINPYERDLKAVDAKLKESQAIQNNYTETQQEFRDELSKQIGLLKEKQNLVHGEANELRASNVEIANRLSTEKLTAKQRNELLKQLDDNKNKISDLSAAWFDYEKTGTDAVSKISDSLDKQNEEKFANSKNWIEQEVEVNNRSLELQLEDWKRVQSQYIEGSKQRLEAEKEIARVQKDIIKESQDDAKTYIETLKKIDELKLAEKENQLKKDKLDSDSRIASLQALIDTLDRSNDLADDNVEKANKQSELADLNTTLYLYQNDTLANISDELAAQLGLTQEKADAIQRQNDLIKAQQELENTKAEKNVRLFKDGSFQWVADPRKLTEAQEKVDSLIQEDNNQKIDKINEYSKKVQDKTEELNTFITELNRKHQKQALQDQIAAEQAAIKAKELAYQNEKDVLDLHYKDVDLNTQTFLENLKTTYGDKWEDILGVLRGKVSEANRLYAQLAGAGMATASSYSSSSSSGSSGSTSNSSPSPSISVPSTSAPAKSNQQQFLEGLVANGSAGNAAWAQNELDLKKYAEGGLNTKTGLAWLDGTTSRPEMVLKPEDTENLLKTVNISRNLSNLFKLPDFSKLTSKLFGNSGSNDTHFNIEKLEIKANNPRELMTQLSNLSAVRR